MLERSTPTSAGTRPTLALARAAASEPVKSGWGSLPPSATSTSETAPTAFTETFPPLVVPST